MSSPKILIGCEFSGIVRHEFAKLGYNSWSCDLLPTEIPGQHIQDDIINHLNESWDLAIFFPPCTHLAVSGARWFKGKQQEQSDALNFVRALLSAPIPRICLENPVGIISSRIRKPDQIVQPWMFGDEATKTTCLWLNNLPLLKPTNVVSRGARHITKSGRSLPDWYNIPPRPDRWKLRSTTFPGFARALASQYGAYLDSVLP